MAQKLVIPVCGCRLEPASPATSHSAVCFKSAEDDRRVRASGTGTVMATGRNGDGRVVAVLYQNACNRATGKVETIVFRYFHIESVRVSPGDHVTPETVLGWYGGGGVQMETDTDTAYPLSGKDPCTLRNPLEWLHCMESVRQSDKIA